jgi:hypothetical protein
VKHLQLARIVLSFGEGRGNGIRVTDQQDLDGVVLEGQPGHTLDDRIEAQIASHRVDDYPWHDRLP